MARHICISNQYGNEISLSNFRAPFFTIFFLKYSTRYRTQFSATIFSLSLQFDELQISDKNQYFPTTAKFFHYFLYFRKLPILLSFAREKILLYHLSSVNIYIIFKAIVASWVPVLWISVLERKEIKAVMGLFQSYGMIFRYRAITVGTYRWYSFNRYRYLAVLSTRTYLERRSGTYCRPITDSGTPCSSSPKDRKNVKFVLHWLLL